MGCLVWAAQPGTVAVRADGGRWLLTGRPEPTLYAAEADVAVVVTEDATLRRDSLPVEDRPPPEPAMDRTRPLAWLRLQDTPASPDRRVVRRRPGRWTGPRPERPPNSSAPRPAPWR